MGTKPGRSARPDHVAEELARHQLGAISRAQALSAGVTKRAVDWRVETGAWSPIWPGIYLVRGAPRTWEQQVMAACLAAGPEAVASHRTAAAVWGLPGFGPGPVEICTRRSRRLVRVTCHRTLVPECDIATVGPIPVTNMARTLFDLGAVAPPEAVETALEHALHHRMTSVPRLQWLLATVGGRGRKGAGVLRGLLAERSPGTKPAESALETKLCRLLRRSGLPEPVRQLEVSDGRRFVARVDLAYPDARLIVEADGREWHTRTRAWERDLLRQNELVNLGWRVLRFTWTDVARRPERVVREVRAALYPHLGGSDHV